MSRGRDVDMSLACGVSSQVQYRPRYFGDRVHRGVLSRRLRSSDCPQHNFFVMQLIKCHTFDVVFFSVFSLPFPNAASLGCRPSADDQHVVADTVHDVLYNECLDGAFYLYFAVDIARLCAGRVGASIWGTGPHARRWPLGCELTALSPTQRRRRPCLLA